MLKTLFTHLLFRKDDVLILDMYAGVEHLGRATVDFVDAMLVVVEPTRRSLGTAAQIKKLANDIGLTPPFAGRQQGAQRERSCLPAGQKPPGCPCWGCFPADPAVQEADRLGMAVYDHVPALRQAAQEMAIKLEKWIEEA